MAARHDRRLDGLREILTAQPSRATQTTKRRNPRRDREQQPQRADVDRAVGELDGVPSPVAVVDARESGERTDPEARSNPFGGGEARHRDVGGIEGTILPEAEVIPRAGASRMPASSTPSASAAGSAKQRCGFARGEEPSFERRAARSQDEIASSATETSASAVICG